MTLDEFRKSHIRIAKADLATHPLTQRPEIEEMDDAMSQGIGWLLDEEPDAIAWHVYKTRLGYAGIAELPNGRFAYFWPQGGILWEPTLEQAEHGLALEFGYID